MSTSDDNDDNDYDKKSTGRPAIAKTQDRTEQYCRELESELQDSRGELQAAREIERQKTIKNNQLNKQLAKNEMIIQHMEKQTADLQTQLETIRNRQKPQNNPAEQKSIFISSSIPQKPMRTNSLVEETKGKKVDQTIYNIFIQETVLPLLEGIAKTAQENQLSLQELSTMGMDISNQISRLISVTECKERPSDSSGLPWSSEVRMTGLDVNITGDFDEHSRIDDTGDTSTRQNISPEDNISIGSTRRRDSDIMADFPISNHGNSAAANNLAIIPIETSSSSQSGDNQSWRHFPTSSGSMNLCILVAGFYLCFQLIMIIWHAGRPKYEYVECRIVKI